MSTEENSDPVAAQVLKMQADIDRYVASWDHVPKQRTPHWYKMRKTTIGGSEMSTITGDNHYDTIASLVAKKIDIGRGFSGDIRTRWGTLFEDVLKEYVEHDLHTTITGTEITTRPDEHVSYSPDGLGVVMVPTKVPVEGDPSEFITVPTPRSCLFEFKCPFNRIPNGSIPAHYLPQVKTGLDLITVVDLGIFCEAVIRRCAWEDLNSTKKHDRGLVPKPIGKRTLAFGFVGFYSTAEDWGLYSEDLQAMEDGLAAEGYEINDTNDFGTSAKSTLDDILTLCGKKTVDTFLSRMVFCDGTTQDTHDADLEIFVAKQRAADNYIWGILPYKILSVDYHHVEKTPGYVNSHREKIVSVLKTIQACNDIEDLTERRRYFDTLFGANIEDAFEYQ